MEQVLKRIHVVQQINNGYNLSQIIPIVASENSNKVNSAFFKHEHESIKRKSINILEKIDIIKRWQLNLICPDRQLFKQFDKNNKFCNKVTIVKKIFENQKNLEKRDKRPEISSKKKNLNYARITMPTKVQFIGEGHQNIPWCVHSFQLMEDNKGALITRSTHQRTPG
ncbi:hypothetical protein A3Q56_08256 [Intoshia linei]|uniref:Uncharacterized protein n=1 Tax=Intoshia linei TaxID=1819745 RepID=A0A177AQG3_9BILA|nr:hypothetical protein A3Q56_08256 [Intoshia linei]